MPIAAAAANAAVTPGMRPGTDVALFTGLLADLWAHGARGDASGMEEAVAVARRQTPDAKTTAQLCGLAEPDVGAFFAMVRSTPRAVSLFSQGVNQSSAGADKVNAIINTHLLTGRIGVPGAGPFSITPASPTPWAGAKSEHWPTPWPPISTGTGRETSTCCAVSGAPTRCRKNRPESDRPVPRHR